VLIDSQDAHHSWSTVGASSNIIEASMHALVDSIEYGLIQNRSVLPDGHSVTRPARAPAPPTPKAAAEA